MSLINQMQDDVGVAVSEEGLKRLSALATQQVLLEKLMARLEEELKGYAAQLKTVSEELIPAVMTELNISEFKLADGTFVGVKKFYSASLAQTNPRRLEAMQWLRENNFGDLVKNEVSVVFGRGEDEKALTTIEALKNMGLTPAQEQSVHASTLKAFIKEQVEAGKAIPLDLFKAYIGRKSTVETPKEK